MKRYIFPLHLFVLIDRLQMGGVRQLHMMRMLAMRGEEIDRKSVV